MLKVAYLENQFSSRESSEVEIVLLQCSKDVFLDGVTKVKANGKIQIGKNSTLLSTGISIGTPANKKQILDTLEME